jgi:hypothetical protein
MHLRGHTTTHGRPASSRRPSFSSPSHHPLPQRPAAEDSFAFAFDNPAFADRVLCVRLLPDADATHPAGKAAKARTFVVDDQADDSEMHDEDYEEEEYEGEGKGKEAKSYEEGKKGDEVMRVHVNSMLLAGRSRFFLSLFSAGMLETSQKEVWLSIHEEEKEALLDILGFLYRGAFKSLDFVHLLKILLLSDKYDVPVALEAASRVIQRQDLSPHQCEVLLDLQSSLAENKAFNPAVAHGRDLLEAQYSNLDTWWSRPEVWSLGHNAMRLILGSESTRVTSENTAFAILERWLSVDWDARHVHIPELARLLRWSAMDVNYLQDVVRNCEWLTCFDWFKDLFTEAVMWHAFSPERKAFMLANTESGRFRHRPEPQYPAQSLGVEWEVDVGQLQQCGAKHVDSPPYEHHGYHFTLQLCKEQATGREGSSSVGLYVFVNSGPLAARTAAASTTPCFLPVASQITVRNPVTRATQSVRTTDHYTALNSAWGWKDFLRSVSWEDLLAKRCDFVSPQGIIAFSATIHLPLQ